MFHRFWQMQFVKPDGAPQWSRSSSSTLSILPTRRQHHMCLWGWVIAHFYFLFPHRRPWHSHFSHSSFLHIFINPWRGQNLDESYFIKCDKCRCLKINPFHKTHKVTNASHYCPVFFYMMSPLDRCSLCVFDNMLTWFCWSTFTAWSQDVAEHYK